MSIEQLKGVVLFPEVSPEQVQLTAQGESGDVLVTFYGVSMGVFKGEVPSDGGNALTE